MYPKQSENVKETALQTPKVSGERGGASAPGTRADSPEAYDEGGRVPTAREVHSGEHIHLQARWSTVQNISACILWTPC